MDDLRLLPKFRDSLTYLYVEHCRVDREQSAILLHEPAGTTQVPAAGIAILMLGPGTRVTHAAMVLLAENNCLTVWCGEQGVRFYAAGVGGTRSASGLLHQARLVSHEPDRLAVAVRMYRMRFGEAAPEGATLEQLRGWEGRRVRNAYARASSEFGLPWHGRNYDRGEWQAADPVNRALSAANSCL
ncbi:MAG: type I-E CRISPR-associated endonuclease Cas1, partial [SAR202 cluster bacterium]|nr:type I-E CRISPR-associated endonuclease Cas1 [SAR202 cluster bacterium]